MQIVQKKKLDTKKFAFGFFLTATILLALGSSSLILFKDQIRDSMILRTYVKSSGIGGVDREVDLSSIFESLFVNLTEFFNDKESAKSLILDMKFKEFQNLKVGRNNALRKGRLDSEDILWSKAKIKLDKKEVDAKVRLKGDFLDHLATDKWSLRVNVRKDNLDGMRKFSAQGPYTRDFHTEPLIHFVMGKKGIIFPRNYFADLTINGTNRGLMYIEEHFDEALTEASFRPFGPLLKYEELTGEHTFFDEDLFWSNDQNLKTAMQNFDSTFKREQINFENINSDLWAKYLAVTFVFKCFHGNLNSNIRYYFHPLNKKFEPISFDNGCGQKLSSRPLGFLPVKGDIIYKMLRDKHFRKALSEEIKWWQDDIESSSLKKLIKEKEALYRNLLSKDSPFLSKFKISTSHLNFVQNWINDFDTLEPQIGPDEKIILTEEQNERVLPTVSHQDGQYFLEFNNFNEKKFSLDKIKITLKDEIYSLNSDIKKTKLNINEALNTRTLTGLDLSISYINNYAQSKHRAIPFFRYIGDEIKVFEHSNIKRLSEIFFIDDKNKTITLRSNSKITISETIVLPKNYDLVIEEGSNLKFAAYTGMVVNGGLKIKGSKDNPIQISGDEKSNGLWSGLLVLANARAVKINYLNFQGGTGIFSNAQYRGAFTVVNSNLEINNSYFSFNKSEDAVNLNQVIGKLDNIFISNTPSDGLDIDFGNIDINRITLINIGSDTGADAIDMSKSRVTIHDSIIKKVTDKGLSVGENSYCEITNIEIDQALVGFSSKDSSELIIENAKLSNIEMASAMAYRKKSHHIGGLININKISTENKKYIVQKKSLMTIENKKISTQKVNVDELYSNIMLSVK